MLPDEPPSNELEYKEDDSPDFAVVKKMIGVISVAIFVSPKITLTEFFELLVELPRLAVVIASELERPSLECL